MKPRIEHEIPEQVRHTADAVKLALRELVHEEPEVLREFVAAVWGHTADGVSRSAGRKLMSLIAGALLAAGIWFITISWSHGK